VNPADPPRPVDAPPVDTGNATPAESSTHEGEAAEVSEPP
jgi:hypothetical protein